MDGCGGREGTVGGDLELAGGDLEIEEGVGAVEGGVVHQPVGPGGPDPPQSDDHNLATHEIDAYHPPRRPRKSKKQKINPKRSLLLYVDKNMNSETKRITRLLFYISNIIASAVTFQNIIFYEKEDI